MLDGDITCNICGGDNFIDIANRGKVKCGGCGSLERTRVLKLFLDLHDLPKPGTKVMHFAPEKGLYKRFGVLDIDYHVYDIIP